MTLTKIVLTGGGTAGHVTPNIAIISELQKEGCDLHYIGTRDGIEYRLITQLPNVTYHSIQSGKLRRYADLKNLSDPFLVMKGIAQSAKHLRRLKPHLVFSKGGFVSVPVVIGAWLNRIPVIIHESDITPGLANKIASRFATAICTTFPDTAAHFRNKAVHTGTPIRNELFQGNQEAGYHLCGFTPDKPVVLVMGGSLGAEALNQSTRAALSSIMRHFQVVHLCGQGRLDPAYDQTGYKQFDYVGAELPDLLAITDVVVSRAGANSIYEFLALKKPSLLIPLPKSASRGDQILNAQFFKEQGFSRVLPQEALTADHLYEEVMALYHDRARHIRAMEGQGGKDSIHKVLDLIKRTMVQKKL